MPDRDLEDYPQNEQFQRDEIARLAYFYWQTRGCENGHDVEDWLMAEQEILRRPAASEQRRTSVRTAA